MGKKKFWLWAFAQSCPILCDPMDYSPLGPSVHWSLQAKILEWVAMPFSRGSSQSRAWTRVSHIAGRLFSVWATREAWYIGRHIFINFVFYPLIEMLKSCQMVYSSVFLCTYKVLALPIDSQCAGIGGENTEIMFVVVSTEDNVLSTLTWICPMFILKLQQKSLSAEFLNLNFMEFRLPVYKISWEMDPSQFFSMEDMSSVRFSLAIQDSCCNMH